MPLYYPPSQNAVQKTLGSSLSAGATSSVTLNNVTGIQNKPGVFVVDRVDSNGNETDSKREFIGFTAVSGSTLTTLTRNVDGSGSDQDHAAGAIVEFIPDAIWADALSDALANLVDTTTLAVDTTKVVTPSGTQSLTNKTISGASNTLTVREADLSTADNTTADVSTSKHGFAPKAPNDTTKFLRGDASWAAIQTISASVYNASNATINDDAAVTFDSEAWDTSSIHSTVTNTSRLTVPSAGKYLLTATIIFGTLGTDKYIYFKQNGTVILYGSRHTGVNLSTTLIVNASTNDYFEVFIYDAVAGTSNTVNGGANQSIFQIVKLSD